MVREWTSRAGWLQTPPTAEPRPERRSAPADTDTLRDEVSVLRERVEAQQRELRALEERLEKRRDK